MPYLKEKDYYTIKEFTRIFILYLKGKDFYTIKKFTRIFRLPSGKSGAFTGNSLKSFTFACNRGKIL